MGEFEKIMMRLLFISLVIASFPFQESGYAQSTGVAAPQHEANFASERTQANDLFLAGKILESLPLYEDLCRQDPTIAVFAERHGSGLLRKEATIADPTERTKVHNQGISEIERAKKLGDNSPYVQAILDENAKSFVGAVVSSVPLSSAYTYKGKPESQAVFREAEMAYGRSDYNAAAALYIKAAALDPAWYQPPVFAGDMYFRLKDLASAGLWFAKAIAIDPDCALAYRYWGDALFQAGDRDGARQKFVEAVVAEPYSKTPYLRLNTWAQQTQHQLVTPSISRPEFTSSAAGLNINAELVNSTQDGRSSWIIYQQYRVAHGAGTLNQFIVAGGSDINAVVTARGYEHTIAEEHAALRAMLADVDAKLQAGTLVEANLDPSIRNVRNLEKANVLGAWIAINAADAGIRQDYPEYRAHHRKHLVEYVNGYLIR